MEGLAQELTPPRTNMGEVRVFIRDADKPCHLEIVGTVDEQVKRHAHRDVGLQRRVHGNEQALGRLIEVGVGLNHPIKNGLAVFGFTNLKVGAVGTGLNKISCRVDIEEPTRLPLNLSPDQKAAVKVDAEVRQRLVVTVVDLAHCSPHNGGCLRHRGGRPERLGLRRLGKDLSHALGDGQVARAHQHNHPLASALKDGHFAKGRDLVHARIGTGI